AHPALFAQLARYSSPSAIPPRLVAQAVAAAGGGTKGEGVLAAISANQAAIAGVIAAGPQLQAIAPYAAQLQALAKVPPGVLSYLKQHGGAVQQAAARTAGQWKAWYWACFGGIVFFLLCIPLLRGRWSPAAARRDEREHEAMVAAELEKLGA